MNFKQIKYLYYKTRNKVKSFFMNKFSIETIPYSFSKGKQIVLLSDKDTFSISFKTKTDSYYVVYYKRDREQVQLSTDLNEPDFQWVFPKYK